MAILVVLALCIPMVVPGIAAAVDPLASACEGVSSPVCESTNENPLVGPDGVITRVIGALSIVVGVVAIIVIILAGFKYTKSGGNSGELQQARDTIIYAAVALAVSALAQAIVIFVLSSLDT